MTERIAIAGAGMAGAYLYRLLRNRGVEVDLFDRRVPTQCGIKPCAWGTSRGFHELVAAAGLDPERYVLRRIPQVFMDEFRIPADLLTVDKPLLIRDLLGDAEIRYEGPALEGYDRLIDATGAERSFLPAIAGDRVLRCVQTRVRTGWDGKTRIRVGGVGYAWSFPLDGGECHLGCGTLAVDPAKRLEELGWLEEAGGEVVCRCASRIRLTGPRGSQPFFRRVGQTEVWGVGESIGCVAPLAGDGIVPGMRSAALLIRRWNDPAGYTSDVLGELRWMEGERRVLEKLAAGRRLLPSDALVLRRNARRMGMAVGVLQAARLIRRSGGQPARRAVFPSGSAVSRGSG